VIGNLDGCWRYLLKFGPAKRRNQGFAPALVTMKLLTEYLEHALTFERMASEEENAELRLRFEEQAAAYRKLAAERAARYGLPPPSPPARSINKLKSRSNELA